MVGWRRAKWSNWQRRSTQDQVETSTRWVLFSTPWIFYFSGSPQIVPNVDDAPLPMGLVGLIYLLGLVQCLLSMRGLRKGMDFYLGTGPVPVRWLVAMVVVQAPIVALLLTLVAADWVKPGPAVALALFGSLPGPLGVYGLCVTPRRALKLVAALTTALTGAFAVAGMGWASLVVLVIFVAVTGCIGVFAPRSSTWYLSVMRELDQARTVQPRLAVAEERLRFSRDLHDVMGRNLSVIALKSELATQLARRGAESAVEQMEEVQRLARESQTEVRAVVRGYREVGLQTELAGARGVLRAAGVDCRVEGGTLEMPPEAQSALGWVVREGATNVLRHAEASWCAVHVSAVDLAGGGPAAVLVMENDGVSARPTKGGSGLVGLRERLAALGGTLTAERTTDPDGAALFRLRAEVPVGAEVPGGADVPVGEDAGVPPVEAGAVEAGAVERDGGAGLGYERPSGDGVGGSTATG
ncbi:histidine kinase [Streptomyces sp. NBC_01186]|uniref:sensor histidine kinase n=1 Tax=unclassified Streptomyces TaxID=2593676 RepID=UPI002DDA21DB|nr:MULTISPECIES: histidine kinase [unclassified Streptomyces]WSB77815.1 histidine kinase [Streptomyces sp. NBC_01775]WSS13937.1 histidine kinase [Streptomyces sp. NBC_01186]